jgi:hypothetical protein
MSLYGNIIPDKSQDCKLFGRRGEWDVGSESLFNLFSTFVYQFYVYNVPLGVIIENAISG